VAVLLLCLLAACGGPGEPVITSETAFATTETPSTTEETTAKPPKVPYGQNGDNGVHWRVLDLDDEANTSELVWLEEQMQLIPREAPDKEQFFQLSEERTLIQRERSDRGFWTTDIFLLDKRANKETLLIEGSYDGEERGSGDIFYAPHVKKIVDERYFIHFSPMSNTPPGVYDTQRMRNIPIEFPPKTWAYYRDEINGKHYYASEGDVADGIMGQLHIVTLTLENVDNATKLKTSENLLAGIPEADMETFYQYCYISPDARYFIVCESGIRIFNLQTKKFVARVPIDEQWYDHFYISFRDEQTLYFYPNMFRDSPRRVLEITLP